MDRLVYKGAKTKEISFPLGGLGTDCIGLGGNGRLVDWEIFNKPNKGSSNGFSHFAIKAECENRLVDARVLNSDYPVPYVGMGKASGFGPDRSTMAEVPHFLDAEFTGEFPIAKLDFIDESFPGKVAMTAFNPFIPLNDKDSSIPAAFFAFEIKNNTDRIFDYTICLSLNNPHELGTTKNSYQKNENIHLVNLSSFTMDKYDLGYGDLTIATDIEDVSYQEYWYRGGWFDNLEVFWKDFTSCPKFSNRSYNNPAKNTTNDVASLAAHVKLKPNEQRQVRFIISWNYPNCKNYWNPQKCDCNSSCCKSDNKTEWKNYYCTLFSSSIDSAVYSLKNWDRLYQGTYNFLRCFIFIKSSYGSTGCNIRQHIHT